MTPSATQTNPPHATLSEHTRIKLPIAAWVIMLMTIGGAFGAFAVAQYQIASHEHRIEKLEGDRELLHRIDERTAEIKRQIDRLAK